MAWHSRVCFRKAAWVKESPPSNTIFSGPHFARVHEMPLLTRPPAPMSFRPARPFRRGQAADVGDDETHVRLALSRKSFSGRWSAWAKDCSRGLVDPQPDQEVEDAWVAPHVLRELVVPPPVRSWSSWQCLSSRSTGVPAKLSMMAVNWRKSPSSRNLIFRFMETQAMSFHSPVSSCVISRHQPVDVAVPVPDGAPRPVVGRLRLHAEVLHGGVGLRDDLHLVPFFPEGGHDLARQIGFPGAR